LAVLLFFNLNFQVLNKKVQLKKQEAKDLQINVLCGFIKNITPF